MGITNKPYKTRYIREKQGFKMTYKALETLAHDTYYLIFYEYETDNVHSTTT